MKENWEVNWKDYFKTLQVDPEAEPEIIKDAFERLARKYHPDINKNPDATQRMKEINEAYDILGNAEKRKIYYMAYLQRTNSVGGNSAPPQSSPHPAYTSPPPYSSPPRTKAKNGAFNSVCQRCGKPKRVVFAHYNKNIGMGFSRREQTVKGYFCAKCVRVLFLQYFFTCLALGWFGIVSLITNPFRIIFDVFQYLRSEIRLGGVGRVVTYSCLAGILVFCSLLAYKSHSTSGSTTDSASELSGTLYSVTISPASPMNLMVGSTLQFVATASYIDGSTADVSSKVIWGSYNGAVATISSVGLVTGITPGATRIAASLSGITSASESLTVALPSTPTVPSTVGEPSMTTTSATNVWLTAIIVMPVSPADLLVGANQQFTATGHYSDYSSANITYSVEWSSNNTAVASISSTGYATGIAPGSVNITASLNGVSSLGVPLVVTSSLNITTTSASPSLVLLPTSGTAGTQFTVTGYHFTPYATVLSANITWNGVPSTGTTFTVDSTGSVSFTLTLTADTSPGTYTLVVTDSSGKQASATFTVN